MNLSSAKALIAKLHTEGLTNAEIARRLAEKGYKSHRTGKPIDQFGVGYHVRHMAAKPVEIRPAPPEKSPTTTEAKPPVSASKLQLALEILKSDLPDTVKSEVVVRVLNS